jgi:ParB family chromosome partitioning protein
MARKNLLASVTNPHASDGPGKKSTDSARSEYALRGASRSMLLSIDEMAENSRRLVDGEAIISLDPNQLDASFVADRIDNDEGFLDLCEAIREHGQASPILVRPSPNADGRFMIVFGHRRARAAKELGIPVRAVVKTLEDISHIIAQGQENTARANLSFIEKALFAQKLGAMGQSKNTVKSALTIDDTLLSRMLSIVETIPADVIDALGAARGVGRDRWEELKRLLLTQSSRDVAIEFVKTIGFDALDTSEKFQRLISVLQIKKRPVRRVPVTDRNTTWSPKDAPLSATIRDDGRSFSITLRKTLAGEFGNYISENLERIYEAFKESEKQKKTGD